MFSSLKENSIKIWAQKKRPGILMCTIEVWTKPERCTHHFAEPIFNPGGAKETRTPMCYHQILRLAGQTAGFAFFCPICEYFTRLWPYFLFVRMKEM
jgi:hypothetical protein